MGGGGWWWVVVCGGMWWCVVVCGGLWWYVVARLPNGWGLWVWCGLLLAALVLCLMLLLLWLSRRCVVALVWGCRVLVAVALCCVGWLWLSVGEVLRGGVGLGAVVRRAQDECWRSVAHAVASSRTLDFWVCV